MWAPLADNVNLLFANSNLKDLLPEYTHTKVTTLVAHHILAFFTRAYNGGLIMTIHIDEYIVT
jgi:hypothetical protein